jgi:hypothetical protein
MVELWAIYKGDSLDRFCCWDENFPGQALRAATFVLNLSKPVMRVFWFAISPAEVLIPAHLYSLFLNCFGSLPPIIARWWVIYIPVHLKSLIDTLSTHWWPFPCFIVVFKGPLLVFGGAIHHHPLCWIKSRGFSWTPKPFKTVQVHQEPTIPCNWKSQNSTKILGGI